VSSQLLCHHSHYCTKRIGIYTIRDRINNTHNIISISFDKRFHDKDWLRLFLWFEKRAPDFHYFHEWEKSCRKIVIKALIFLFIYFNNIYILNKISINIQNEQDISLAWDRNNYELFELLHNIIWQKVSRKQY